MSARLADLITENGPDRNLDEETMEQQQKIDEEIAKAQALVSRKQGLGALESEYNEETSKEFFHKAKELKGKYENLRRVRGDGNCFYRAVAFAYLERLLSDGGHWKSGEKFDNFCKLTSAWKPRLLKLDYPKMTTEDFCEVFADFLKQWRENPSEESLLGVFNAQGNSDYMVVFMRLVTGAYLLENEAEYGGFIEGEKTVREYVEHEISPMNKECDHLCIIALSKALDIPIRVEYMDRSQGPAGGWHHDFTLTDGQEPMVYFLYRPGHYDILYPKKA